MLPVIGKTINGARLWIGIGPLTFQPGELAKIALTVFFAGYLVTRRDSLAIVGRKVFGVRIPRARELGPCPIQRGPCLTDLLFELGTSRELPRQAALQLLQCQRVPRWKQPHPLLWLCNMSWQ